MRSILSEASAIELDLRLVLRPWPTTASRTRRLAQRRHTDRAAAAGTDTLGNMTADVSALVAALERQLCRPQSGIRHSARTSHDVAVLEAGQRFDYDILASGGIAGRNDHRDRARELWPPPSPTRCRRFQHEREARSCIIRNSAPQDNFTGGTPSPASPPSREPVSNRRDRTAHDLARCRLGDAGGAACRIR